MNHTLTDIITILERGSPIIDGNAEMLDLRYVLDQYSDRSDPVIQVTQSFKVDFIKQTSTFATAGCKHDIIEMFNSYELALRYFNQLRK